MKFKIEITTDDDEQMSTIGALSLDSALDHLNSFRRSDKYKKEKEKEIRRSGLPF